MIILVRSSPSSIDSSATKSGQYQTAARTQIDTLEYDLPLLEEVRKYIAYTPEPKEKMKSAEDVTQALMNHGIPFKNLRLTMDRFSYLKRIQARSNNLLVVMKTLMMIMIH